MKKNKILIVGSYNTFYIRSYINFFVSLDIYEVAFLNINSSVKVKNIEGVTKIVNLSNYQSNYNSRFFILLRQIFNKVGLSDSATLRKISILYKKIKNNKSALSYIDELQFFEPQLVFCFWGTTLSPYIDNLKIGLSNSKFLLSINTYPVSFKSSCKKSDAIYFNKFNALIFPSSKMSEFFHQNYLFMDMDNTIVNPDFIEGGEKLPLKKSDNALKKVIFLGNVDFNTRKTDDIRKKIEVLLNSGMCVYVQEGPNITKHPNIFTFKPFTYEEISSGSLSRFINKNFDGVFYAYNSFGSLREQLSITTRFSLSEFSNVPVLIEKNKYEGILDEFKGKVPFIEYSEKDGCITDLNYLDVNVSDNLINRKKALNDFVIKVLGFKNLKI